MTRGISSGSVTRKLCLVIGIVMPRMSASWKASVPIWAAPTWPVIGHHRDRVHVGVGDRRDQVGGAGAAGGHADADLAGGHGVPLRRVAGALLVADEDVPDLRVEEGVVRREDRATRDAEDVLRAGALERLDQALRTGDRLGTCGSLLGHLLIISVAVRPTKNPSCLSADEGWTRGVRVWGLSSRVACVRESQNAWAQRAPAPLRAQLSVPPVPDRGIEHPASWLDAEPGQSVPRVGPGGPALPGADARLVAVSVRHHPEGRGLARH